MGIRLSEVAWGQQQSRQCLQVLHTGCMECLVSEPRSETRVTPGTRQIALHDEDTAGCLWDDTSVGRHSRCPPRHGRCQDLSSINHTATSAQHIAHMLRDSGHHRARWGGPWQTDTRCLQTFHINNHPPPTPVVIEQLNLRSVMLKFMTSGKLSIFHLNRISLLTVNCNITISLQSLLNDALHSSQASMSFSDSQTAYDRPVNVAQ